MKNKTIAFTVQNGLCISCGICRGICPRSCIHWIFRGGMYLPEIDTAACVSCGLCHTLCPGLQMEFDPAETAEESMTGPVLASWNVWSRDPLKRHHAASGGVLSSLIPRLLELGLYDSAFCLDSYDYRQQLHSRCKTAEAFAGSWSENRTPKSRYLPVSHEEAVAHIRNHPADRLILVGTSCAIQGLARVIHQLGRNREQYLLIGLFCDKVFSYNILSYYRQARFCGGRELTGLHFKNKESGGWPGNMKFCFSDGTSCFHDKKHRMNMKLWFMPERCLYCIDKLNIHGDISLGDNYTGVDESPLGSNSVILRTRQGQSAWQAACQDLEMRPISIDKIANAQALTLRSGNIPYALEKERHIKAASGQVITLNRGISLKEKPDSGEEYSKLLTKLNAGRIYPHCPAELNKQLALAKLSVFCAGIRTFCARLARRLLRLPGRSR